MIRPSFIILSHRSALSVTRLIGRLNLMFDRPVVVVHHDQSKSQLLQADLPENAILLEHSYPINWAEHGIVRAVMSGYRRIVDQPRDTDWVTLLSETDYPIKSADVISRELGSSTFDAYIDAKRILPRHTKDVWHDQRVERYQQFMITPTSVDPVTRTDRQGTRLSVRLSRLLLPFYWGTTCWAGSMWMTLRSSAAAKLVQAFDEARYLDWHYQRCVVSDESHLQTLLMDLGLRVSTSSDLRYIDWTAGGNSPKTLTTTDLPEILASTDHFARKFDLHVPESARAMDLIDAETMK